jgi:hypothetical protein
MWQREVWSHMLRCERTKIWKNAVLNKRFSSIDTEEGVRRRGK